MKKILVVAAVLVLILANKQENNIIIPNDAIRFRVVANSNSIEDQMGKLKISGHIQEYIYKITTGYEGSEEIKEALIRNYDNIKQEIDKYIKENKLNTSFELLIGDNYFPKKNYKGVTYKEGYYSSVVIKLGHHQGLNWWCVIYPPLCLIDENKSDVEYTTLVKELLG